MRYVLLAFDDPQAPLSDLQRAAHAVDEAALHAEIVDGGQLVHTEHLAEADMATTVRMRNAQREVLDRPHSPAGEQLDSILVIEVPDLDAALEVASRCPSARSGAVEVRPVRAD